MPIELSLALLPYVAVSVFHLLSGPTFFQVGHYSLIPTIGSYNQPLMEHLSESEAFIFNVLFYSFTKHQNHRAWLSLKQCIGLALNMTFHVGMYYLKHSLKHSVLCYGYWDIGVFFPRIQK